MAPPSSGGSTVGEALNILENVDLAATYRADRTKALHDYLEASALAFADRGKYVGAPSAMQPGVLGQVLSQGFADERFCALDQTKAATKPVPAGSPDGSYATSCDGATTTAPTTGDHEGLSTSHLTVVDRWGNIVTYTLTIEQTGGSALTVPGRGFLLNNELTDFDLAPTSADAPNAPGGGKRPRSSMAPTIVTDPSQHGRPVLATGSPGGSTIITTVLQVLLNKLDFGMSLPQAVAAPRASQRNTADVQAEPGFDRAGLAAYGHTFVDPPAPGEIGAVTAIALKRHGRLVAVAEPVRRGGGDARVVRPGDVSGPLVPSWGGSVRQGARHGERLRRCCPTPTERWRSRPTQVQAVCDRRAGIGARRRAARRAHRRGHGGACAVRPAAPPGSWTTATRTARSPRCAATASASSRGSSSTRGSPAGRVIAWPPATASRHVRARADGQTSPSTWVRRGCPAPTCRCVSTEPGRPSTAAAAHVDVDMGNPHAVVFVDDLVDVGS